MFKKLLLLLLLLCLSLTAISCKGNNNKGNVSEDEPSQTDIIDEDDENNEDNQEDDNREDDPIINHEEIEHRRPDNTLIEHEVYVITPWYAYLLDKYGTDKIKLPSGINNEAELAIKAAKDISKVGNWKYDENKTIFDGTITKDVLKKIGPNQIVIFVGHGSYNEEYGPTIWNNTPWDFEEEENNAELKNEIAAGRIVNSEYNQALTGRYISKYCGSMDNSIIFLGQCESAKDERLATEFLAKGAACVIGFSDIVQMSYGNMLQYDVIECLSNINPDTNNYYTVNEALAHAQKLYGDTDKYLYPAASGARAILYGNGDKRIVSNEIEYDILKIEDKQENIVYSPLSIKMALSMLLEGSNGNTKTQISNCLGAYTPTLFNSDSHKFMANGLFVRDSFNKSINNNYKNILKNKYDADIMIDSFNNSDIVNNWVKEKTHKQIDYLFDDISDLDFILANTIGIDMEWNNKVQKYYSYAPAHERFSQLITDIEDEGYRYLNFNNKGTNGLEFSFVTNKYDIISDLGKQYLIDYIAKEYSSWRSENIQEIIDFNSLDKYPEDSVQFAKKFVDELSTNYGYSGSSTDFSYYVDDGIRVFAKDLKTYDNITLQYVAIMPLNISLSNFIRITDKTKIDNIIGSLIKPNKNNCEEGYITCIHGAVPTFSFQYELSFIKDLHELGISDIFDSSVADLSNIAKGVYIDDASHRTNIDFSNEGIKAAAVTTFGGRGAASFGYEHLFDVPIKDIDLTFDSPFIFVIRNTKNNEYWFVGTVYEGNEFVEANYLY